MLYTKAVNFVIRHEKFEGPLDLLLELIQREELAISEISLSKVAEEYLQHVKTLERIDPDALADFLVIAAQLILLKSRSLLPSLALAEEDEHSLDELTGRLEEYKKIRELAGELKIREQQHARIISREPSHDPQSVIFYPPPQLTLEKIRTTFAGILAAIPKAEKLAEEKLRRVISLQEKIAHIRAFLSETVEHMFSELVGGAGEKIEIIVSFLAILELVRQKFIDVSQENLFEDITIRRQIDPAPVQPTL